MKEYLQGGLHIFVRFTRVAAVVVLLLAVATTIGLTIDAWDGLENAHTLIAIAGGYLLIAVLAVEALRRTGQYIFLGDSFFKGKPDLIFKIFIALPLLMLIAAAILIPFAMGAQAKEKALRADTEKANYEMAKSFLSATEPKAQACIEEAKAARRANCELKRDKIKSDYNFCLGYDSAASCLYNHNYTEYQCDDKGIENGDYLSSLLTMSKECVPIFRSYSGYQTTIKDYENSHGVPTQ